MAWLFRLISITIKIYLAYIKNNKTQLVCSMSKYIKISATFLANFAYCTCIKTTKNIYSSSFRHFKYFEIYRKFQLEIYRSYI